jgi:hypothetical protein
VTFVDALQIYISTLTVSLRVQTALVFLEIFTQFSISYKSFAAQFSLSENKLAVFVTFLLLVKLYIVFSHFLVFPSLALSTAISALFSVGYPIPIQSLLYLRNLY